MNPSRFASLALLLLWAAPSPGQQPAGGVLGAGSGGIVPVLEGSDAPLSESEAANDPAALSRLRVDGAIASAIAGERAGNHDAAIEQLRAEVKRTGMRDAKARYFLARSYLVRAEARRTRDAVGAEADRGQALFHLRSVTELARTSPHAEDRDYASHARAALRKRVARAPVLNQHAAGRYPYGYCAPTALRMALRLEGLQDPGPDAVALSGAAPYIPGQGSDPSRLALRARELGLTGASYRSDTRLAQITASLDAGRPVLVGGEGPFRARLEGGGVKERTFPWGHWLLAVGYEADAQGQATRVVLNDPDGGHRLSMTRADFLRFFAPEGDGNVWAITYTR